jgi:Tol biopolymer transport system component/DNA-directed RNA polymerase subunit RPC12/RpoP
MIKFSCMLCGEKLSVQDQLSGKRIRCPKCNNTHIVPAESPRIKFECRNCGQGIRVLQIHAGKKGQCPKCKSPLVVPSLKADPADGSETVTVVCSMCNESIRVPKGSKGRFVECPACGSNVETSLGGEPPESDSSIPSSTDEYQYEEESDLSDEDEGPDRRLILVICGAAAVVVVGLIILVTVILPSGSGPVEEPDVSLRQQVADADSRPRLVDSDTEPVGAFTLEPPKEDTLSKEPVSLEDQLFKQTKIAFTSGKGETADIYVMNADGSEQTRLTDNPARDLYPSWSPDGTKITFTSHRDGERNAEIYVMSAAGSEQKRLTKNSFTDETSSWSPDGEKIAFVSWRERNSEIYVMNADGSEQKNLTNNRATIDNGPSWSPDGQKIAFHSSRDRNNEIYVMNADGSEQKRLTYNPAHDYFPSWSPDGRKIAFSSRRDSERKDEIAGEIYVMNADGSEQTRLTDDPASDRYPSWSPDGKKIAFSSNRDGDYEIYLMNADGSGLKKLTNNSADDYLPSWLPFPRSKPQLAEEREQELQEVADTNLRPQPVTSGETGEAHSSDLKLRLQPGQKHRLRIIREDKVSLSMMGQRQDINSISTVGLEFEVEQIAANSIAWIKVTYLTLRERGGSAVGQMEYDSTKPDDPFAPTYNVLAPMYSAMMGQSFVMKVTPDGKTFELKGVDEMYLGMAEKIVEGEDDSIRKRAMERMADGAEERAERSIENLNQRYGSRKKREEAASDLIKKNPLFTKEKIRGMVGNVIMPFPGGPAEIGDSWQGGAVLPAAAPVDIDLTYTLKEKRQGVVVIDISSKIELVDEPASTQDSPLGPTKASMTGSYEGALEIDSSSGWMIRKKATMRCSGQMKMAPSKQLPQGTTLPMSMESITTVEPIE